jgi:hypothetical protein
LVCPPLTHITHLQNDLELKLHKLENRGWFSTRKLAAPPPPLHPSIVNIIKEWFALIDEVSVSGGSERGWALSILTVDTHFNKACTGTFIHTYTCAHTCTHIHSHTHTHTHTHCLPLPQDGGGTLDREELLNVGGGCVS